MHMLLVICFTVRVCQNVVRDIEGRRSDAKWLKKSVDSLFVSGSQQHKTESQQVEALILRYQQLLPAVEITSSRSSIVVRCHDYKEAVERQMQWLTETEEKVREDVPLDDMESVRILLGEQEVID